MRRGLAYSLICASAALTPSVVVGLLTKENAPRASVTQGEDEGHGAPPEEQGPRITIPLKRDIPKVGRNDLCPCGSGKKYKACCGRGA